MTEPFSLPYAPNLLKVTAAHIGVGAFHRAHQQVYYDDLARQGVQIGVMGVNLTPPDISGAHGAQGGRYAVLAEDAAHSECHGVGTLRRLYDTSQAATASWDDITFVTLTITEKGYCHHPGTQDLDLDHVAADLATPDRPRTAIGYLAWMLERRRHSGGAPITLASCDNVPQNGQLLKSVLQHYARHAFPQLLPWMESHVRFPVSMVDRIVPAMTAEARNRLEAALGHKDAIGVVAEPFRQWVIEDNFAAGRPPLERAGVQIVRDITPYVRMKYRLLNGLQSAYAELGRLCGCASSYQASTQPDLAAWATVFHASQAATLECPAGEDLATYGRTSLERLQNPRIHHPLNQIASDASLKLPQRIAEPAETLIARGDTARAAPQAMVLAAWALNGGNTAPDAEGFRMSDPLAQKMAAYRTQFDADAAGLAAAVLSLPVLPQALAASDDFRGLVEQWISRFGKAEPKARAALIGECARENMHA